VFQDWQGKFIYAATFNLGAASILIAEATTMRNGVRASDQTGFTNIHIEGDDSILIRAVNTSTRYFELFA